MAIKKEIQITISEDCNLNCIYCYEANKSHNVISISKVKEILYNELSISELEEAIIYFHGGEVAIHFDLIEEICDWVWLHDFGVKIKFAASTNGTLIHGEIKEWCKLHAADFYLGLSLDGTKAMHDVNRNNSFDMIDLPFFRETWSNQSVKMTISPQTINQTSEGIIYILSQGFHLSANLAYGCDWDYQELKKAYAKELFKLSEYFLDNPNIDLPFRPLVKDLELLGKYIVNKKCQKHKKWCGMGEFMVCYSPEGDKYPCQMFMPSSGNNNYVKPEVDDIEVSKSCENCSILSICPSCYGYNYINTGVLSKAPDGLCDYAKLETLCYSYILSSMLTDASRYEHTRYMSDLTKALCIKGIKYIQEVLTKELASLLT